MLERYASEISRCVRCGSCRAVCPSFLQKNEESFSPRGRMALVKGGARRTARVSAHVRGPLEACTAAWHAKPYVRAPCPVSEIFRRKGTGGCGESERHRQDRFWPAC